MQQQLQQQRNKQEQVFLDDLSSAAQRVAALGARSLQRLPALPGLTPPLVSKPSLEQFLLVQRPGYHRGLGNIVMAISQAIIIAVLCNRTLVLPPLPTSAEATLYAGFRDLFDVKRLGESLGGFVSFVDDSEFSLANGTSASVNLPPGPQRNAKGYWMLLGARPERGVQLVGDMFGALSAPLPLIHWLRTALLDAFAPASRALADAIVVRLRSLDVGPRSASYWAVHLRQESDWNNHCHNVERMNPNRRLCWTADAVVAALRALNDSSARAAAGKIAAVAARSWPSLSVMEQGVIYLPSGDLPYHMLAHTKSVWPSHLRVVSKRDLLESDQLSELSSLQPILHAQVDFLVSLQSDVFVGTTVSTFDNLLAEIRPSYRPSLAFDAATTSVCVRLDAGLEVTAGRACSCFQATAGVLAPAATADRPP